MRNDNRLQFSLTIRNEDFIVRDHRLFQERIMPGVTFVDIVLRFLETRGFELGRLELRNISLKQAVVTSPSFDRKLRLTLEKNGKFWAIHACSQKVKKNQAFESEWVDNMEGELHLVDTLTPIHINIESLKAEALLEHDLDRTYAALRETGIEHYEFMKLHGRIHEGRNYILADVKLGELARQYDHTFCLHPSLLDGAVCLMGMLMDAHEDRTFLPVFFGSFQAIRRLPQRCFVLLEGQRDAFKSDSDIAYIDIDIYDEQGALVARYRRLGVLHVRSPQLIKHLVVEDDMPAAGDRAAMLLSAPQSGANWRVEVVSLVEKSIKRPLQKAEGAVGFYDLGLDSQDLLALVKELEARLGTRLYPTLLFEYNTVDKLVTYLEDTHSLEDTHALEHTQAAPVSGVTIKASPTLATSATYAVESGGEANLEMSQSDIPQQVIEIVEQVLGRPVSEAEHDNGFYDLGLDSQDLLGLVKRLESYLGIRLYPTLLFEHNTLNKLIAHLAQTSLEHAQTSPVQVTAVDLLSPSGQAVEQHIGHKFCYLPTWLPRSLPAFSHGAAGETLVVYTPAVAALSTALAAHHTGMWEIILGDTTVQRAPRVWEVDVDDRQAFARIVGEIPQPQSVYFLGALFTVPADPLDLVSLAQAQTEGVVSLFRFLKAFHGAGYGGKPFALKVVTTDTQRVAADDAVCPHAAAVQGFMRTIAKEYVQWTCSVIDLDILARRRDDRDDCWDDWAKAILAETGRDVALRGTRRLIQAFRPLSFAASTRSAFRHGGVYLIVGTGGIALTLALDLAKRFAARFVFVGRSELDEARRQRIADIEAAGGQVLYLRGDASDEAAMARVMASARARFGEINGVIHTAIVLQDRMLANMDEAALQAALTPKVQGSVVVCRALAGLDLDFLLFFSSALSFSGSIGQANYTAASSFEDALAHALDRHVSYPVHTINWGYWGEVGVVATDEYRRSMDERGFYSIQVGEGLAVLDQVLSTGARQVLAAKASEETLHAMGVEIEAPVSVPKSLPEGRETIRAASRVFADTQSSGGLSRTPEAYQELERFGQQLLLCVLRKMGVYRKVGETYDRAALFKQLAITSDYHRLCDVIIEILITAGFVEQHGEALTGTARLDSFDRLGLQELETEKYRLERDYPEIQAHLALLWNCVTAYPEVLTGRTSHVAVMFPKGDTSLVGNIYRGNPLADCYNEAVAQAVAGFVQCRLADDPSARITLLEIGAGTGGTSRFVLRALKPYAAHVRYFYTDVAMMLTPDGDAAFAEEFPFVEFRKLDIENEATEQGFTLKSIDLMLASNVLHATRNMAWTLKCVNALLVADGVLICNEITRKSVFTTLTFGMTSGWWLYSDEEYRVSGAPLLPVQHWQALLTKSGFRHAELLGLPDQVDLWRQRVIIAESSATVASSTVSEMEARPVGTGSAAVDIDVAPSGNVTGDAREHHSEDPIAIIGVAGRYPKARNLNEFWDNLCQGRDCITEIPDDRWSLQGFYDPDQESLGSSYSKWGGFLEGVDQFDPLFFNISPADAELMDPQERLFLETVWHTLEDAGYTRAGLADSTVGVFVGSMWSQYQLYSMEAEVRGRTLMPSSIHASIPNRTSFFFDFKGPSVAVDTMCSSSLTAIHSACESIRRGECDLAVAGGVNVSIHPHKYVFLSEAGMLSSDGRCRSFGTGGDGFAPGEGVGAVLLEPLSKALADGDQVYALIKGSAIGHSGRTGGYMVPDPQAQARTMSAALRAANIDPGSISYVEAQGIGSALGDPIEVAGLTKTLTGAASQSCAIGSVKSNIGHLESAAGVAALTKVLLQMKHRRLVPSLHAESLNPNIDFAATPFYVQRTLSDWQPRNISEKNNSERNIGEKNNSKSKSSLPRRAAISAFGAGGGNANLIVEEFSQPEPEFVAAGEQLIVLSARSSERLLVLAQALADALENNTNMHLSEIAWTLQSGREAMEERLALVVTSVSELQACLVKLARGDSSQVNMYRGDSESNSNDHWLLDGPDGEVFLRSAIQGRRLDKLGQLWTKGISIDWKQLYSSTRPRRVSLPGYPFARERCWITPLPPAGENPGVIRSDVAVGRTAPAAVAAKSASVAVEPTTFARSASCENIEQKVHSEIVHAVSETLKITAEQLSSDRSFSEYGLGSVSGLALIRRLNDALGIALRTTVLYDYANVDALMGYILESHSVAVAAETSAVSSEVDPIASTMDVLPGEHSEYRALRLNKPGDAADIEIIPIQPLEPADNDVQILVKAFSLNFGDLLCVKGLYPTMPDYPFTPGIEFSGVVLKTGRAVTGVHCGDEVVGLTGHEFGAHSQVVTTPQHFVVLKPENVSHENACAFPVVFLTMHQVFERAQVRSGEKVLIQTAAGGVGQIAVQMALASGAEVFATAGSSAKLDYLQNIGVHHTINYRQEGFADRIRDITDGYGVDVVINTLSGDAIQKGVDILAPWGRYIEIAMTALKTSAKLDLSRFIQNQSFFSIDLRRLLLERPERVAEYLEVMADTLRTGLIKPTVGKVFSFAQVRDAYRWVEARENIGKVVVTADAPVQAATAMEGVQDSPEEAASGDQKAANEMEIAIIGLSGRFPGARNLEQFWQNLAAGKDSVTEVPSERWNKNAWYDSDAGQLDKTYCPWGGFLENVDRFDPVFFNMSGKEARLTDPAQRLFLEECWNAFEMAGCDANKLSRSKCGVFVGTLSGDYRERMVAAGVAEEAQSFWGNSGSVLAARIAYFLNLKGPAVAIDTACSSSLVAIHTACRSIQAGDCDMAVAGGVYIGTTPHMHVIASNAEMLSPSGRCRSFDNGADGFVPGEGVGAIILKPLAAARRDGDCIYGVIRGSGVNQDGRTNGITAPSTLSQTELLADVYRRHGIDPATIGYVEAHGTGTKLGDPIEIEALTNAFRQFTDRRGFCPIGSVKSNIGHAITAAGIGGVMKILLSLAHRQLPPTLHVNRENEHIGFADSPFYVLKHLQEWPVNSAPRRAAISSFGFSGTNAHLIIEEAPAFSSSHSLPSLEEEKPYYAIPLSAKTREALERRLNDLLEWLVREGGRHRTADVAYTLCAGRSHFTRRCAFVVRDLDELRESIACVRRGERPDNYRSYPDGRELTTSEMARQVSSLNGAGLNPDDLKNLLVKFAEAYIAGQEPAWSDTFPKGSNRCIALPTYPFIRDSYWVALPDSQNTGGEPFTAMSRPDDAPKGSSNEDPLKGFLYAPYWVAEARLAEGAGVVSGRTLIIYTQAGEEAATALSAIHGDTVAVILGDVMERCSLHHWQAGVNDPGAYERILNDIGAVEVVYHLGGMAINAPLIDSLDAGQNNGVISLFRLSKALLKAGLGGNRLILKVVTASAYQVLQEDIPNPHAASLCGFVQSLAKECPDWQVSCVDVGATDDADKIAAAVVSEPASPRGEAVAWRGSDRYVRKLSPIDLPPTCETRFKASGVYLIIGGAGGVGLAFSRYLGTTFHAKLVLLGRREPDAALAAEIAEIEAAGAEVLYLQADVADPLSIRGAVAQVKARFGCINGVIHSAMVFEPTLLAELEEPILRNTLAPKVQGTLALAEALENERLDFLLFFSSGQSFTGNAGRAPYAAACQFQDAFAQALRGQVQYPVHVVNWGFWATNQGRISDALHRSTQEVEGAYPLTPEEGTEAVRRVLGCGAAQVLVFHVREHVLQLMGIDENTRLHLSDSFAGSMMDAIAHAPRPDIDEAALVQAMSALARFGQYALLNAFRRMGMELRPGVAQDVSTLKRNMGVIANYDRLFEALLTVLEKGSLIIREGDQVRATERLAMPETRAALLDLDAYAAQIVKEHPDVVAYVTLVRTCLDRYPEILRGTIKATDVMFPGSSMDLVSAIYTGNVLADYANDLVVQVISAYIERRLSTLPSGRRIRIIEIGAGTGGTTRPLLKHISRFGEYLEYVYTDVSLAFTQYGQREYGDRYPFLQFSTFDIEEPIESQGLTPGSYDLVLASNVLHATRDIRNTLEHVKALLARNGWLVMNELTYTHNFSTLTFGTLDGWWLFEDPALRMPASPLLNAGTWCRLLDEQGFERTVVRGAEERADAIVGQHVLVAESNGVLRLAGADAKPQPQPQPQPHPQVATVKDACAPASANDEQNVVTEIGNALVSLAVEVLQIPATAVDTQTPLMDLGLDSLLALDLVKRINQRFDITLTPTDLFDHATVVRLAMHIGSQFDSKPSLKMAALSSAELPVVVNDDSVIREVESEVKSGLIAITSDVLQISDTAVDVQLPFMDLGLDSLLALELVKRITQRFEIPLTPTELFDYATVARLATYLAAYLAGKYSHGESLTALPEKTLAEKRGVAVESSFIASTQMPPGAVGDIAVVGIACRFPGTGNAEQFWDSLAEGRDMIDDIQRWPLEEFYDPDPKRPNRSYCKRGGLLSNIGEFDPLFFGLSPKQAELMDPRQRLFLQETWTALEDAGYSPQALAGKRCSVFAGCEGSSDYFADVKRGSDEFGSEYFLGNSNSILAARIAYVLDLKGPSITLDTACSSSLVAVHLACESIRRGECDMALAGGVMIMTRPDGYVLLSQMGMLSPLGKCHAFDSEADGFVPGEGVGVTVLKPLAQALADGDQIYGVIKASGINQDGKTNGITAPSAASQAELEQRVYEKFNINPATISYVEAHGTGTKLGDPIEFEALKSVFRRYTERRQFCAIGSVKTNIGHTGAAAGVAGLIKVLQSMKHHRLPASLHFKQANEQIDFETSPFYINTGLREWKGESGQPLRAAVSSFGHSGTNAHVVIEEAPASLCTAVDEEQVCLIPLSAKTEESLRRRVVDLLEWLERDGNAHRLTDIAFTLQVGRGHFPYRLVLLILHIHELKERLRQWLTSGMAADCLSSAPKHRQPGSPGTVSGVFPGALDGGTIDRGTIESLRPWAQAYAAGEDVDWGNISSSQHHRISLPTYPFNREHYWLSQPAKPVTTQTTTQVTTKSGPGLHPLLERNISTLQGVSFVSELSRDGLFGGTRDGQSIVPAAVPAAIVPEMARAASEIAGQRSVRALQRIIWNRPFPLEEGDSEIEISLYASHLYASKGVAEFEICVIQADGERVIHSQGTASFEKPAPEAAVDLAAILRRCPQRIDGDVVYQRFFDLGVEPQPRFRVLHDCQMGEGEVLARIELPNAANGDLMALPPALLDGTMQSVLLLAVGATGRGEALMPQFVDAIELHAPLPSRCFAYVKAKGEITRGIGRFDVWLLDDHGGVLLVMRNYTVKALGSPVEKVLDDESLLALFEGLQNGEVELHDAEQRVQAGGIS